MTLREKLKQIHPEAVNDKWVGGCMSCPGTYQELGVPDLVSYKCKHVSNIPCQECWDQEMPSDAVTDAVDHPKHYRREGAMECIDEMVLVFGRVATRQFCVMNAWKYRYRAADKGGEKDMRKSDWYMKKYKELMYNGGADNDDE